MAFQQYPLFTVISIAEDENGWRAQGRLSGLENIGEGWIAYLYHPPRTVIKGRIVRLKRKRKKAVFVTAQQVAKELLQSGQTYQYLDGYWGERVAIVLDPSREWRRTRFVSQDAIEFRLSTGGRLRGRAEDQTSGLSDKLPFEIDDSAQQYGYRDEFDHWVCERCYKRYVERGNINFFDD